MSTAKSFRQIRLYLEILQVNYRRIKSIDGPLTFEVQTGLLEFAKNVDHLHSKAIAESTDIPAHLRGKWVLRLNKARDLHTSLICSVLAPLDTRARNQNALEVMVDKALDDLNSLDETRSIPVENNDLPDLVIGDADAINATLEWIKALNQDLGEAPKVVKAALHAHILSPDARLVVFARVTDDCRNFADLLRDENYKSVVATRVSAWTAPLLKDAADACMALVGDSERGELSDSAMDRWIGALAAAWPELKKLMRLLVARLEQIRRNTLKQNKVNGDEQIASGNVQNADSPTPPKSKKPVKIADLKIEVDLENKEASGGGNVAEFRRGDVQWPIVEAATIAYPKPFEWNDLLESYRGAKSKEARQSAITRINVKLAGIGVRIEKRTFVSTR